MAIATQIKDAISQAVQAQKRVHPYELTEAEYVDDKVRSEIRRYERAIETEGRYLEQIPESRAKAREKIEWKIEMWKRQLARFKSSEWKGVNTNYLREQYAKMVKKAISTGQPVPQHIIDQAPQFKAAQTARERYEKGWKTSFANRSVAINDQMKKELGYKVKRQDGKPITSAQLEEIAQGVGEVEDVVGALHDLFDKSDITIVHTSGKHPFLSGFGGTYTPSERAVNIGVYRVKALGHELGHWLDHEAGKVDGHSSRIYSATGHKSHTSTSTAEALTWYRHSTPSDMGELIQEATRSINKMREVREYMKADYGKDKEKEEKEEIKLVRERLSAYWREPREVWARLVEQYIATKNGKEGLATDSPGYYEHRPGWWTKEDFARMMPRVEAQIKNRLRALRGSDVAPPRKATAEKKLEEVAEAVKAVEKTTMELGKAGEPGKPKVLYAEPERPKGELIARYTERKMSPVTGKDTDYVWEWHLVPKPKDAGAEWMGNPWGIYRTFTKDGKVEMHDLMETGGTKEKAIQTLPTESSYQKATKYGLAKVEDEKRTAAKAAQEKIKQEEEKEDARGRDAYWKQLKELGTRRGVKPGTISISTFDKDYKAGTRKDVPGLVIGNGIGIAFDGEGRSRTYTVTHLNTGLAYGHTWNSSTVAIALAKSIAKIGDWDKYSDSKDIPKEMMNQAASLVRGFTSGKLESAKAEPRKVRTHVPVVGLKVKDREGDEWVVTDRYTKPLRGFNLFSKEKNLELRALDWDWGDYTVIGRVSKLQKEELPKPKEEPKVPKIGSGDVITDGLVNARVIAEGTMRMGRQDVPAYQVIITTGHEAGKKSMILKDQAKLVKSERSRGWEEALRPRTTHKERLEVPVTWKEGDKVEVTGKPGQGTVRYVYTNGYTLVEFEGEPIKGGILDSSSVFGNEMVKPVKAKKEPEAKAKPEEKPPKRMFPEKPKAKKEPVVVKTGKAEIDTTQAKRSDRAILIDRALRARTVLPIESAGKWLKNPNRFDIQGVDTPGGSGRIIKGVGFTDKGGKRLTRRQTKGFRKVKYT